MRFFEREEYQPKDRLGTMDERCKCGRIFNDHYNGQCPCQKCGVVHRNEDCPEKRK